MLPAPILDKKDGIFFYSFGLLIAVFMVIFDKIDLPNQIERNYLGSLFFDHIPFFSICTLLSSMVILSLLSVIVNAKFKMKSTVIHISDRISQLCSPAFFITVGMATVSLILFIFSLSNSTSVISFSYFALLLVLFSWISNYLIEFHDESSKNLSIKSAIGFLAILLVTFSLAIYLDKSPMNVDLQVSLPNYSILENQAKEKNISVNEHIDNIIKAHLNTN